MTSAEGAQQLPQAEDNEKEEQRAWHQETLTRLLGWEEDQESRIVDADYARNQVKQNNKFRAIWFNGINGELHMLAEEGWIPPEQKQEILSSSKELAQEVVDLQKTKAEVTREQVDRGNRLLERALEFLI